MLDCFEKVNKVLPLDTYTIDFAVVPSTLKCYVVEINNPPPKAGCSLFNWDDPVDRTIIEKGPFEFRLLFEPSLQILDSVYEPIQELMRDLRKAKIPRDED